ncbi:MAG: NADH-quinone oxidoreductase subunit N, partial [Caldimicrobium sp.]
IAFILIEAVSFGFYLLISFYKRDLLCVEAGLKYFYLGTLSSIFFFTGLFFIYYSSLEINFFQVLTKLSFSSKINYLTLGLILIFSSLVFKLGASPFHFWLPEVYQGSPLPVFPILIAISKFAFAIFLGNLVLISLNSQGAFYINKDALYSLFYIISLLSMLIGNLFALKQKEVKRLLAYSSISHVGYLLTLLAIPWSNENLRFYYGYIFIYALTNLGIFLALSTMIDFKKVKISINTYQESLKYQNFPILFSLLILLFSLAGLPPSAGFITKFFVLLEIIKKGSYLLAFIFLSTSVLSIYYYFRLINPILAVLKEGTYEKSYEKTEFDEIFIMLILTGISLYLIFSMFKPTFIFFFT